MTRMYTYCICIYQCYYDSILNISHYLSVTRKYTPNVIFAQ